MENEQSEIWSIEDLLAFGHSVHREEIEFHGKILPVYWHELQTTEVPQIKDYVPKGDSVQEKNADQILYMMKEKVWAMIDKGQRVGGVVTIPTKEMFFGLPETVISEIMTDILDLRKKMRKTFLDGPLNP
jgi:hypothetical protein